MKNQTREHETTFGYLSVVQSAEDGYFGGYLIISTLGRPLEFHCTAPVKPNRAQQILYGATLEPYLLGEQIAGTLLRAAKLTPRVIVTDHHAVLCLGTQAAIPLVRLVVSPSERKTCRGLSDFQDNDDASSDGAAAGFQQTLPRQFTLSEHSFELLSANQSESEIVVDLLSRLAKRVDLAEPFGRIHQAIREAQRIGGSTSDAHGEAA